MKIVNEAVLDQFRGAGSCEWCHCPHLGREPHHIFTRGMGGGGRLDIRINLIGLCRYCHQSHHEGHSPLTLDLLAVVAARENTTQDAIRAEINRLRRLDKDADPNAGRGEFSAYPGDSDAAPKRQGTPGDVHDDLPLSVPGSGAGVAPDKDGWLVL